MGTFITDKVASNAEKFLASYRLGVDFGDKAHGVALVQGNEVVFGATLVDESASDLKKRRELRRGRRTRESRRQRLARLRQWCLRNHLPDPDPYFNPQISSVVWPPKGGRPTSALAGLKNWQKGVCHRALKNDSNWQQFLNLPDEAKLQCALINPFIARRMAREGHANPPVFVRALWHLFEHRGFDWYARTRGERDEEKFLDSKDALSRHLKTLVLPTQEDREQIEKQIRERDDQRKTKREKATPWLDDPEIQKEIAGACNRGKYFPTERKLNPPRHYVESELKECLRSLPIDVLSAEFGCKKGQPSLSDEEKRDLALGGLKKLLNWNRREPRFDNRQLRGCTWCAALGIHRNTPRKKNVVEWLTMSSISDIKVAAGEAAKAVEAEAQKQKVVSRQQRAALTAATRWLSRGEVGEYEEIKALIWDSSLDRESLKEKLNDFFKRFAKLPKRVFTEDSGQVKKKPKLHDPYSWHREELLNFADALHNRRPLSGRDKLCTDCRRLKADNPELEAPVGEAEVILSQRLLKARCDRLVAWLKRNLEEFKFPVEYVRIEAVLPRPKEKALLKAKAAQGEVDQLPKEKLKIRLMEEVGARCTICNKPYRARERKGRDPDKAYCQCPRPNLLGDCAYCGNPFAAADLQIEHIYPKHPDNTSGGIGPDAQINKTVACEICNQGDKKNHLPFDYFQGDAWANWTRRVKNFNWPDAKRKIALLQEYKLPEELGEVALARTGMVHRYLRQKLAAALFPEQIKTLKDPKATLDQRNAAKVFLDQHLSTPAGWLTSQCRLDWEHQEVNGNIRPLVPRKSPLLTVEERQRRMDASLTNVRDEKRRQDILEGQKRRARIEDELRKAEGIAVCDRTDLNHHWIDAAVIASLPPQANQPVEMGGVWTRRNREVRADQRFAPNAAQFLDRWGDGSVVFELAQHLPRFKAQQQELSLYASPKGRVKLDHLAPFKPKKVPRDLLDGAKSLPQNLFAVAEGKLILWPQGQLTYKLVEETLDSIANRDLREIVFALFDENYEVKNSPLVHEAVANLTLKKDKESIVSDFWRKAFAEMYYQEYDFPKKRSEDAGEDEEDQRLKTERRRPRADESLPAEAWIKWVEKKNNELKERGKSGEVSVPNRLRIYFEKLTRNEQVAFSGGGGAAPSKRGIPKPRRITRMTPVGSHAVIDLDSGEFTIVLNPWKRHVERTPPSAEQGERIQKGDCIWLPEGKRGRGWYRVTEMHPPKQRLSGKIVEPLMKAVPAWLDINQLIRNAREHEPDPEKRKKIDRPQWEVDFKLSVLKQLAKSKELRIKRRLEDLPGLFEESPARIPSNAWRAGPTSRA